jgi:hypothetical protein
VLIQIVTLVFVIGEKHYLQLVTTSTADMIASAQSLRITRKLWKVGRRQQQWEDSTPVLPHISEHKEEGDAEDGRRNSLRQTNLRQFIDLE